MEIALNNISFKGYDAKPLKALYMQGCSKEQKSVFEELSKIGKEEGFDVFVHTNDKGLIKDLDKYVGFNFGMYHRWAQDNKMFITKNGEKIILYPVTCKDKPNIEPVYLGNITGKTSVRSSFLFEGGNLFLGTKDDGENYLLVGQTTIDEISRSEFAKHELKKENPKNYADVKASWHKKAKKVLSDAFKCNIDDIYVISQPDFHLDMAIRPLKYPYVLVNDDRITDEFMKENFKNKEDFSEYSHNKMHKKVCNYATGKQIAKELEKYGFKPIMIGGIYGKGVNFMNAVIHEHENGNLSYITNSSECSDRRFLKFQENFTKELKEKCSEIKKIYFVKGEDIKGKNTMMNNLSNFLGGIHCMVAEEIK